MCGLSLIHIFHVSLIGMSLYGFLRKRGVGYGWAGTAAAILLFFYGALAGFGASVFRAVFMVFCSFLASYLGRTYDLLSAMALSLILLASDSPYLLFTSGLQLSYGAVGAVGLAGNMKIHGSPLFTAMSASIAIQIEMCIRDRDLPYNEPGTVYPCQCRSFL